LPVTAFQGYFNVRIESLLLGFAMRAIETTGILNTQGQIQLDHPIPQEKDRFVRVILLMSEDELNEKNWLDAVSHTNQIGGYQHIIFALITSRIPENPLHTDIILRPENPDFMISGLRQSSAIRLDHLVTLRSSLIQRELGSLSLKTQTLIVDILSDILRS